MSDQFPSISTIIPRLKEGDEQSWEELVKAFQPGLLAKARWLLRNSILSRRISPEDLVNSCLTSAWAVCGQQQGFRGESTAELAGFLLTVMHRDFVDQCRPTNKEVAAPTWFAPTAGGPTPSEVLMSDEQEARLHAALAELPDRHREVLALRLLDGLKYREIATRVQITDGAVAGIVRDGLKQLVTLLNETGSTA